MALDLDNTMSGHGTAKQIDRELARIQGNILRSHGRDHAMHLMISFGSPRTAEQYDDCLAGAKAWLRGFRVTSAKAQADDVQKDHTFRMLLLSSGGYDFLGEKRPKDGAFRDGMRDRRAQLEDLHQDQWADRYRFGHEALHGLVIIAAAAQDEAQAAAELDQELAVIAAALSGFGGQILVEERGSQLRDAANGNQAIEHFGYADGLSQPDFFAAPDEGAEFDQSTPLKRVLEEDRHAKGHYGSYLVYRTLAQDVDSWNAAVGRVAGQLALDPELLGAMAVGRFKDGTPVTDHDRSGPGDSNFTYDNDGDGNRCPFHAHIRKTNPRESLGFLTKIFAKEGTRRIARRGITYDRNGERGLIFMCFQADITDQFEFMQRKWSNEDDFPKRNVGIDPVSGQQDGTRGRHDAQNWPTAHDSGNRQRIEFGEHIRLRGGDYFFAPSLKGLKNLARAS